MIPSLPKLLGLIAIIWVVWTFFRIYETRQGAIRARQTKDRYGSNHDTPPGASRRERTDADHSIDLQECKICGAWFSEENCGCENFPH